MIAIDTNVLVRLLTRDSSAQAAAAERAIQAQDDILLLTSVLLETEWVLRSVYNVSRDDVAAALERLLDITTPETPMVRQALRWFADGMDWGDALHLAHASAARCNALLTFDVRFAKAAKGCTPCAVVQPG